MKNLILLLVICNGFSINAQSLDFEWAKQFGSIGVNTRAYSMTTDPSGNLITLGGFKGSVDFDPGAGVFTLSSGSVQSSYICKLDSSGNFVWAEKIDIDLQRMASDRYGNLFLLGVLNKNIDLDPGPGIYSLTPTGGFRGMSTCIIKLDNSGNFVWAKAFFAWFDSNSQIYGQSISVDANQNIFVGGSLTGAADCDPGPDTAAVGGGLQWGKWGDPPSHIPRFFICSLDSSGNFRYAKQTTSDNEFGYNNTIQSGAVTCNPAGETISFLTAYHRFSGGFGNTIYTPKNILIEKRDIIGNLLWSKNIQNDSSKTGNVFWPTATFDRFGNILVAGYFSGLIDFDPSPSNTWNLGTPTPTDTSLFLLKLNSNGDFVRASHMHRSPGKPVYWYKIFTDAENSCYLSGSFSGTFDFAPGPQTAALSANATTGFLLKTDQDGQFKWVKTFDENTKSYVYDACLDNFGNLYLSGGFSGSGDFNPDAGNYTQTANGSVDAYYVKLSGPLITSIRSLENNLELSFYPNPAANQLFLNLNHPILHGFCRISDINGKIVIENKNLEGKEFVIDIASLNPGFYFVEISEKNANTRLKIIKD